MITKILLKHFLKRNISLNCCLKFYYTFISQKYYITIFFYYFLITIPLALYPEILDRLRDHNSLANPFLFLIWNLWRGGMSGLPLVVITKIKLIKMYLKVETWKVAWFLVFYEGSAVAHWTVHFVLISYMKIWFIYDGDGMNEITAKYTQCQI